MVDEVELVEENVLVLVEVIVRVVARKTSTNVRREKGVINSRQNSWIKGAALSLTF